MKYPEEPLSASQRFLVSFSEKEVEKVWGKEYWIENGQKYCLKVLSVHHGFRCSLHYHPIKDETFLVLSGSVDVELGALGERKTLKDGEKVHIPPNKIHRFGSMSGATILEISTHHSDDDVVRLEDSGLIPYHERAT